MNYVAYYRVSTKKQGASGLGLESQKDIVNNFVTDGDIITAEFIEVESGKNRNRIELEKALHLAKKTNSTLIVAKLDRLARDVEFLFKVINTGIEVKFCDMPVVNTLLLGVFGAVAQYERELISGRTKSALEMKKRQGVKLGMNNLTADGVNKSVAKRKEIAKTNEENNRAYAYAKVLRSSGLTLRGIADKLNESNFKTSKGNKFYANSVKQLLDFFENN